MGRRSTRQSSDKKFPKRPLSTYAGMVSERLTAVGAGQDRRGYRKLQDAALAGFEFGGAGEEA